MSQFIGVVPDPMLRDTLISRLAVSPDHSAGDHAADGPLSAEPSSGEGLGEEQANAPQLAMPRHRLAVICKAALSFPIFCSEIRRQPWKSVLQHVEGAELMAKIFESALEPEEPAGIAAFFGSLPKSEAAILSLLLANKELNEKMGPLFWQELVGREFKRRKRQVSTILRLAGEDPAIQRQANEELKEVLDLESRFTDISRLPSREP